jgi:hypothetical protein
MSEKREGAAPSHFISGYLIRALSAQAAYSEAQSLQATLGDVFRSDEGQIIEHKCIGFHDLDTLQEEEMNNGTHLLWLRWPSADVPAVRKQNELSLFLPPILPSAT